MGGANLGCDERAICPCSPQGPKQYLRDEYYLSVSLAFIGLSVALCASDRASDPRLRRLHRYVRPRALTCTLRDAYE